MTPPPPSFEPAPREAFNRGNIQTAADNYHADEAP
jgi:hypothetical protein